MTSFPCVRRESGEVEVSLMEYSDAEARVLRVNVVLDLDGFGGVLGMEILNLKLAAGEQCLNIVQEVVPSAGRGLRYGYDGEVDAFYLRLTEGRSIDQDEVQGCLVLNRAGEIVAIRAGPTRS